MNNDISARHHQRAAEAVGKIGKSESRNQRDQNSIRHHFHNAGDNRQKKRVFNAQKREN